MHEADQALLMEQGLEEDMDVIPIDWNDMLDRSTVRVGGDDYLEQYLGTGIRDHSARQVLMDDRESWLVEGVIEWVDDMKSWVARFNSAMGPRSGWHPREGDPRRLDD